jgi:uncharacterized protein (TIGR02996 family)
MSMSRGESIEEAFLADIRDAPDDDAPRLIYADWLDDQGRPGGEFIRLQCAQARLPEGDRRRVEIEARLRRLRWQRPRFVTPRGTIVHFRRGLPDGVTVYQWTAHEAKEVEELMRRAPIQRLRVAYLARPPDLMAAPFLARLSALHLGDVGPEGVWALLECPYLRGLTELRLGLANPDQAAPVLGNATFTRLRTLEVSGWGSDFPPWVMSLRELVSRVRELKVHLGASNSQLRELASWPLLGRVTEMSLKGQLNQIGLEGAFDLAASPFLPSLKSFSLMAPLAPQALATFAAGRWMNGLERFAVRLGTWDRRWGDDMARILAGCSFSRLSSLSLYGNRVSAAGARALARSPHLDRLTALDLNVNSLGDAGACVLAEEAEWPDLATLNLSSNGLRDTGAEALASAPKLSRLVNLHLRGNAIGPAGARALLRSGQLAELQEIHLPREALGRTEWRLWRGRFRPRPR